MATMPDIPTLFLLALLLAALLIALFVIWPLLRRSGPPADAGTPAQAGGDEAARLNQEIIRERRARLDEELAELPEDSPERAVLMQAFAQAALADLQGPAATAAPSASPKDAPPGATPAAAAESSATVTDLSPGTMAPVPADTAPGATPAAASRAGHEAAPDPCQSSPPTAAVPRRRLLLAVVLATLVVALPLAFYRSTGMPEAADPAFAERARRPDMATLLAELERRLAEQPELVEGWLMLGRSRMGLGQHDKAIVALEKALQLDSPDPALAAQIRTDLADALGQQAGSKLTGRPWELLQQALALKPDNPKAMALAGAYQLSRNQPQAALQYWEPLLAQLQPGSPQHQQVSEYIANVRARIAGADRGVASAPPAGAAVPAGTTPGQPAGAGTAPPAADEASSAAAPAPETDRTAAGETDGSRPAAATQPAQGPVLSGELTISPALAPTVRADDTVFLSVRAVDDEGEPVGPPLAVRRLRVAELPHRFALGDADAMLPMAQLSQHRRVRVTARVGRDASPRPGDLEGRSPVVAADAADVRLQIDRRLP